MSRARSRWRRYVICEIGESVQFLNLLISRQATDFMKFLAKIDRFLHIKRHAARGGGRAFPPPILAGGGACPGGCAGLQNQLPTGTFNIIATYRADSAAFQLNNCN